MRLLAPVWLSLALGLGRLVAAPAPASLVFSDITEESGIDFVHAQSPTTQKYLIETMGGGVALLDADGDGQLDVFFSNGAELADPMPPGAEPQKTSPRFANRLYRGRGAGRFSDVTDIAGLSGAGYSTGVAVADYDNDGDPDLYVTGYGANRLYRNEGGRFEDVTASTGVAGGGWSTSAAFLDYDNDGWLDLFVCRYVDFRFETNPYCGERRPGYREYCHPRSFPGVANLLYRNQGDGRFRDVSEESGIARHVGKALGVAIADYDGDGWIDIYVANDAVPAFLFHNRAGRFEERALEAGVAVNGEGTAVAGMGVDFADYDNDARPDLVVTTLSGETYPIYRNAGDGSFVEATLSSGVAEASFPYSGWGTRLLDLDNDGWKDLLVSQGHVLDTIELTSDHLRYAQPLLLLRGGRRRFENAGPQAGAALEGRWAGRGAAFGDLDDDGDVDVVVGNCGQRGLVLRNDTGSARSWLSVELVGTRSNRDGIGASLSVRTPSGLTLQQTLSTASSYQSASDKRVLFGLGSDALVERLEVRWPSGAHQTLKAVSARQHLRLREPES